MINAMRRTDFINCAIAILIPVAAAGYTKIYNAQSLTCLINGDWFGSSADEKSIQLAQKGDAAFQYARGIRLIAGACLPYSAENRHEGLEWLQKAAQSEPAAYAEQFYSYARLYRRESPAFLPTAQALLANLDIDENGADILRLNRAMMNCDRGETEWTQCREVMRAEMEAGNFYGKWYYAEILARGLGGETDRDKAAQIVNSLIEITAEDLPALGAVSEMNALRAHQQNLFSSAE